MEKRKRLSFNAKGNKSGSKKLDMAKILSDIDFARKSVNQICEENNITRKTLHNHYVKYKAAHPENLILQDRKSLCDGKPHPQYKHIDMEQVYQLLDSGKSVREVCEIVGCSKTTLYKKYKQYEERKNDL